MGDPAQDPRGRRTLHTSTVGSPPDNQDAGGGDEPCPGAQGWMARDVTRLLGQVHNLKPENCLFLEFSACFWPRVTERVEGESREDPCVCRVLGA